MRTIWTGAISFGLVNIPIRVYSAVNQQEISFDMLDKKDHAPIRYKKVNDKTGKEVEYKDIVKGYEYEKGEYIIVDQKDFDKVAPEKTKSINILDFVKESEIDSVFFDKPYYLEPDKGAAKAYALLREALQKSKKVGIAEYVMRNRVRMGALKVSGDIILLNQLRYYSEIRKPEDLNLPTDVKLNAKEIDMAIRLIDQLTAKFKPDQYVDTYVDSLKKVIEAKAKGKTIKTTTKKAEPTKVTDLMAVLKESLKASGKKRAA